MTEGRHPCDHLGPSRSAERRQVVTVEGVEPPVPGLEPGQPVVLPGRGTTWVRDLPGPFPGAPTVLLLHGWTVTADLNWSACYRPLQRRYRVVALDHRGHGRGIRSRRPFRLEDCADDAAALCHVLGIDRVVACGYSMGGPVAQLLWRRHHDLVAGLVLCATGRRFGTDRQRARVLAVSLLGASFATWAAGPLVRGQLVSRYLDARIGDDTRLAWAAEQVRRNDPTAILQAGAALAAFDSRDWIGEVDVPTSVVVTTRDQVVAVARQRNLAAAIPGAHVEEVDGPHAVVVEAPGRFNPALLRAMTAVKPATRSRAATVKP